MGEGMGKKQYEVGNNTDLRGHPVVTSDRDVAERAWARIRPTRAAGNLYEAWFRSRCAECGGWNDETVKWDTCRCCI